MIRLIDKRILGIITFRCNDTLYNDWPPEFYEEAYIYSARKVARKYSLLTRFYSFDVIINLDSSENDYTLKLTEALGTPVKINLMSFDGEILVKINGIKYNRTDDSLKMDSTKKEYSLFYSEQSYLFNYTFRTKEDNIEITYQADITVDDFDDESITPVIPPGYDDEIIKYALIYIAEAAAGKFATVPAKLMKYKTIYNLNIRKGDEGKSGESESFPTIKVFHII